MKTVTIAAGQGALGESPELMLPALEQGVDYLVCDSLAESTCTFLAQDQRADETAGYAPDLLHRLDLALPFVSGGATTWITNAGGMNPVAAHQAALAHARARGFGGVRIALVFADVPGRNEKLLGREVYLGAGGVVEALAEGADVVITGRVADAALFLAPAVHELGWAWDDWDRLAAGTVVGHVLECSAQASGGNYSGDWWETVDLARVGPPLATVAEDGTAVITKPQGTGGRVSTDTVREQLLYEVHDPARYLTPDVVVDFTTVHLRDVGPDRVEITGATGGERPPTLKGLDFEPAGWAGEVALTYAWPDAEAKCRWAVAAVRSLAGARELPVLEWCEEYFGIGGFGGPTLAAADRPIDPPEVVGRLAWRTSDATVAQAVLSLVGRLALSGPPGLQGIGRTRKGHPVSELVTLTPFFVPREDVEPRVHVRVEVA